MESLIFVLFSLFQKKKIYIQSLVQTIWVIEICPFFMVQIVCKYLYNLWSILFGILSLF